MGPNKYLDKAVYIGARLFLVSMLGLSYFYFTEKNPVELTPFPFEVPKVIHRGETFAFDFTRCADYRVEYTFNSYVEEVSSGTRYYMQAAPVVAEKGCFEVKALPKVIPESVNSSDSLKIKYELKVFGKMRTHYMEHETSPFQYIRD